MLCAKAFGEIVILILESGKLYKAESSKHSSILLTKLDESIRFDILKCTIVEIATHNLKEVSLD